jgi:hypothetical protein
LKWAEPRVRAGATPEELVALIDEFVTAVEPPAASPDAAKALTRRLATQEPLRSRSISVGVTLACGRADSRRSTRPVPGSFGPQRPR